MVRGVVIAGLVCALSTGCAVQSEASDDDSADTAEQGWSSYEAQVSQQVRRGSQPDHAALADLKQRGYRSIVNLRSSDDERGDVLALGMDPHHIAVADRQAPTMQHVIDFLEFVTEADNRPIYVHCHAGQGRTGVFVAAYRMAVQNWSQADAIAEARHFGMSASRQVAFLESFGDELWHGHVHHYGQVR